MGWWLWVDPPQSGQRKCSSPLPARHHLQLIYMDCNFLECVVAANSHSGNLPDCFFFFSSGITGIKTKFQNIWNIMAETCKCLIHYRLHPTKKISPHTRGGTDPTVELVSLYGTLQLPFGKRSSTFISSSGS